MNHPWNPLRQDTLFQSYSSLLEQPGILRPEHSSARQDTLNAARPFTVPPFPFPPPENPTPLLPEEREPEGQSAHIERQLKALRASPGFKLIAHSALLLKACQLDMDFPPSRQHYVRQQLITQLTEKTGKTLNPDTLTMTFSTENHPAVDDDGHERYSARLSLTELALATFDPALLVALNRSDITDMPLSDETPSLSTTQAFRWVSELPLDRDYSAMLEAFRARHAETFRVLSRLSFLDTLARQYAHRHISLDGYILALDALGLSEFPVDAQALEQSGCAQKSEVRVLSLGGETVPGIFQIRSKTTSHCFIHVLGAKGKVIEYINDDPQHMTDRLLAAMNASGLYGHRLHALEQDARLAADARLTTEDLFSELTQVLLAETSSSSDTHSDIERLTPITRSLALAGAVDLWQADASIVQQIPVASRMAAQVMAAYLQEHHGLTLNPDHVFIAYQSGNSINPLGSPRNPSTYVHTPDEKPVSLSEALMNNYRVDYPQGYLDRDGRTVVFLDTTGKGERDQGQLLAIPAQALEGYIKAFGFLSWMTRRIDEFWGQQKAAIEQTLLTTLITQALISLKRGHLKRGGFDQVVEALATSARPPWLALGFFVQGALIDGMTHQYTGLLVIDQPGKPKVLYQAGHPDAFMEFADDKALEGYLNQKTAQADWREAVMRYVPVRHHQRLDYLFKLWGRVQAPSPPASILRPWTDALYNPDTQQALHHSLCEKRLEGSPFAFFHQLLKQNALDDAEDRIVTSEQVSQAYWTSRLQHLQCLLLPMSLLLTPAFVASLATEIGLTSLSIAATLLPGGRYAEKNQALLATLSLGLMQLGTQTPRLLRTLSRIVKPAGHTARVAGGSLSAPRSVARLRQRLMKPRQTRLEKFFHTDALLKRWSMAEAASPSLIPVHAWKLGRRFLLWTSDRGQARTLVVSTHGYYTPWTATVKIPNGSEIRTYAPHGYELVDPKLHRIVNKNVRPFAISNTAANTLIQPTPLFDSTLITDKFIAGTSLPGRLKNYSLSKFQTTTDEPYEEIARVVRNSNASPLRGWLPPTPTDVLTVRNRFGMTPPSLADLFNSLSVQGIHYDRILLVHCRCAAISAVLRRAPVYHAPTTPIIQHGA
ncbi:dermonecrotic toxin domain-containing protein [Pseudomonas syringae]|uniref:dermonecrotic toxin domain-containing protein n=1 Tax=Pseudomonas syringae TaxID=317 RepID=UPI003F7AAFC6